MTELRNCIVSGSYVGAEQQEGFFHLWAQRVVYDDAGQPHAVTFGIVEMKKDGKVLEVEPIKIRFTS